MNRRCNRIAVRFTAAAALLFAFSVVTAEPPGRDAAADGNRTPQSNAKARRPDRAAVKEALQRRLKEVQEREERLGRAIRALDANEAIDPELVRRLLDDARPTNGANVDSAADAPGARPASALRERAQEQRERTEDADIGADGGPRMPLPRTGGTGQDGAAQGSNSAPTTEQRAVIREVLAKTWPDLANALQRMERTDPRLADTRYVQLFGRMRALIDLRRRDPEAFSAKVEEMAMAREAAMLAREIAVRQRSDQGSDAASLASAKQQLRDLVARQFDSRRTLQEHEITHMQARVDESRAQLLRYDNNRDKIIDDQAARYVDRECERLEKGDAKDADEPAPSAPSENRPRSF